MAETTLDVVAEWPAAKRRGGMRLPDATSSSAALAAAVPSYVTIALAAQQTGYSEKAIRRKIESGVWVEGREFRRAPDGHILISMQGYVQWVEQGRA